VTCTSDCERLQRENACLERRLDEGHQLVADCDRREQEAVQRVRDTLQLVDEAQLDKEEVSNTSHLSSSSSSYHDVRYSYRPLSGIAVVSMSIYLFLFTVLN